MGIRGGAPMALTGRRMPPDRPVQMPAPPGVYRIQQPTAIFPDSCWLLQRRPRQPSGSLCSPQAHELPTAWLQNASSRPQAVTRRPRAAVGTMAGKPFRVEALLPVPARPYFLERDSAAFRSLLAKVRSEVVGAAAAGARTCGACRSRLLRAAAAGDVQTLVAGPCLRCRLASLCTLMRSSWQLGSRPACFLCVDTRVRRHAAAARAGAQDWHARVRGRVARGRLHLCQDHHQARVWQLGACALEAARGRPPRAGGRSPASAPAPDGLVQALTCGVWVVRMLPQVPKTVANQLQSSNLEFHDIIGERAGGDACHAAASGWARPQHAAG